MSYTLPNIDEIEADLLAPYAQFSNKSFGRIFPEERHFMRSEFQRDRDRIIHSSSFRRLEYKTQVFLYHYDDNFRTRLTHSLEVAQVARSIAKILRLNVELSEAIALAHDLGHSPFGHAGEKVLKNLMADEGGFDHNQHTIRIVETLEKRYPEFDGLNLSYEVKEGLAKHRHIRFLPPEGIDRSGFQQSSLEAQLVDISDSIAYNSHDLDDGLSSGLITFGQLKETELWQEGQKSVEKRYQNLDETVLRYQVVRHIINAQVSDLVEQAISRLNQFDIETVDDVRHCSEKIVRFSPEMQKKDSELRSFLKRNLYQTHDMKSLEFKVNRILTTLFEAYDAEPHLLPEKVFHIIEREDESRKRTICDYIAGMTDRFAIDSYKKVTDPTDLV